MTKRQSAPKPAVGKKPSATRWRGTEKERAQIEIEDIALLEGAVSVPVNLSMLAVQRAIALRDPLMLCPHDSASALAEELLNAAADPALHTWAAVLQSARVPWLAWMKMRQEMPTEATVVFEVWATRMADQCAAEIIQVADMADYEVVASRVDPDRPAQEFAAMAHAALRIKTRQWLAERLDRVVYGRSELKQVQGEIRVTVAVVDET